MRVIDSFRPGTPFHDFSNFGPSGLRMYSQLEDRWIEFPHGEHGYQWPKTLDPDERAWILASATPGIAKRRGQQVKKRPGWDDQSIPFVKQIRYIVMRAVVDAKFQLGTSATELLLSTEDAELIEGNYWHDQTWGDCRCGKKPECAEPGSNWLGKILMECRTELLARQARPVFEDR